MSWFTYRVSPPLPPPPSPSPLCIPQAPPQSQSPVTCQSLPSHRLVISPPPDQQKATRQTETLTRTKTGTILRQLYQDNLPQPTKTTYQDNLPRHPTKTTLLGPITKPRAWVQSRHLGNSLTTSEDTYIPNLPYYNCLRYLHPRMLTSLFLSPQC